MNEGAVGEGPAPRNKRPSDEVAADEHNKGYSHWMFMFAFPVFLHWNELMQDHLRKVDDKKDGNMNKEHAQRTAAHQHGKRASSKEVLQIVKGKAQKLSLFGSPPAR